MPASFNTPPQTNQPSKPENTHKALQVAQERSDPSSVVRRPLGTEAHYEPMQLLAGQYISHHLSLLHRKCCFQSHEPPPEHLLKTTALCYWYEFIVLQYFVKAMELLCYNRNSQVKNQLLILHKKSVLSNYTSKEEALRRDEQARLPLGPSEAFQQGD